MKNSFEKECPKCKTAKAYVKDSRPTKSELGYAAIRRRRQCVNCGYRWSTYEITVEEYQHLREQHTRIAYQLVEQFKMQIDKWLLNHNPKSDIDGINRK